MRRVMGGHLRIRDNIAQSNKEIYFWSRNHTLAKTPLQEGLTAPSDKSARTRFNCVSVSVSFSTFVRHSDSSLSYLDEFTVWNKQYYLWALG